MPTPWSSSGSLLSDRIPSHPPPPRQQQQQNKGKGKGKKASTPEPPKTKTVRALEARLDGARTSNGHSKDPKGGCFCQARIHALSSYVSMCRRCGLILCTLNPPYCACPHCSSVLLDRQEREALMKTLEEELAEQITREETERKKVIEEARAAEGAFPTLPGSAQTQMMRTSRTPPPSSTARKVLSLNSETKRVTVSSYSTPPSRSASRGQDREEDEGRVPGPPGEVKYATERPDPVRPWKSARAGDVRYVPVPAGTRGDTSKRGENMGT